MKSNRFGKGRVFHGVSPADGWKTEGQHVQVSLSLDAEKSVFVVFRKPGKASSQTMVREWGGGSLPLAGPWSLSFQKKRGAPARATFDKLVPWNEHADPGIKYFSGTATNSISFDLPKGFLKNNQEVWLDLGQVAVMAEVRLNGKNLGVLWHKPFRTDVSGALKPGTNQLEVDVTNLWVNRLIGDEQQPSDVEWADNKSPGPLAGMAHPGKTPTVEKTRHLHHLETLECRRPTPTLRPDRPGQLARCADGGKTVKPAGNSKF